MFTHDITRRNKMFEMSNCVVFLRLLFAAEPDALYSSMVGLAKLKLTSSARFLSSTYVIDSKVGVGVATILSICVWPSSTVLSG